MSDYYADLNRIKAAGAALAAIHVRNGATEPWDSLFSGEWADGLTPQDALSLSGIDAQFSDLDDYEQTDVLDSFEDGYRSADVWPQFPILQGLINAGHVTFLGNDYVGHASDGTAVHIGNVGREELAERYLTDYPTPDKW